MKRIPVCFFAAVLALSIFTSAGAERPEEKKKEAKKDAPAKKVELTKEEIVEIMKNRELLDNLELLRKYELVKYQHLLVSEER